MSPEEGKRLPFNALMVKAMHDLDRLAAVEAEAAAAAAAAAPAASVVVGEAVAAEGEGARAGVGRDPRAGRVSGAGRGVGAAGRRNGIERGGCVGAGGEAVAAGEAGVAGGGVAAATVLAPTISAAAARKGLENDSTGVNTVAGGGSDLLAASDREAVRRAAHFSRFAAASYGVVADHLRAVVAKKADLPPAGLLMNRCEKRPDCSYSFLFLTGGGGEVGEQAVLVLL